MNWKALKKIQYGKFFGHILLSALAGYAAASQSGASGKAAGSAAAASALTSIAAMIFPAQKGDQADGAAPGAGS